jgi:hypothetical protein
MKIMKNLKGRYMRKKKKQGREKTDPTEHIKIILKN